VNVASAKATEIPFTVNAKHQLAETVRFDQKVDADKFTVNVSLMIMILSPCGFY